MSLAVNPEKGEIKVMDTFDLAVILAAVLGIALIVISYWSSKKDIKVTCKQLLERMDHILFFVDDDRWGGGGGGDSGDSGSDGEIPLEDLVNVPEGKIGAKKRKKLEMKAEKRAMRDAEFAEREERKEREEKKRIEQEKKAKKEREVEKQKEEEERLRKEEEARREQEEYERMKADFELEEEGFDESDKQGDSEGLLQRFVNHIKTQKIVQLEDLAAEFKLKIQDVIDRISELQKEEVLTGVIDDRGKFIYITEDELKAVATFIRQRGRVSIAELAENSSKLIGFAQETAAS
ncbi:unnamed protein product [Notodromas monacha]|uniref:DDRGK domain-containing protein 1 n=1 Tax=Notodromas monacha TaxID=399045 RepID=A0A7R9GE81_9CRUS|nr:unnamed protein product [Notodromas monacha]CAG0917603.1 unnamed protein product [Notodromas monacha]